VKHPVHRYGVAGISVRSLPWMQHLELSRARARERQRRYRAGWPLIDYFPDPHAATTIDSLRTRCVGGDASSVLNRIVREWSSSRGRDPPPSV
jgi:hypothetical protein